MAPAASGLSRKDKRKQERQEKKQRKLKKPRVESQPPTPVASKSAHEKPRNAPRSHNATAGRKRPSAASGAASSGGFQNKFHELVQQTTGRSMHGEKEELSREDAAIKALERNLGLASKKDGIKRLQKEYVKDGLGEDFADFLSSLDNISELVKERKKGASASVEKPKKSSKTAKRYEESEEEEEEQEESGGEDEYDEEEEFPSDMEMDEETRREFKLLQQEDAEFLRGMDELPTDESDLDSDEDLAAFESEEEGDEEDEEEEDDDDVRANTLKNAGGEVSEEEEFEEEEQESEEEEEPAQIEEDIYGRPVLKNADGAKKPSAYIPPHLRRQMQEQASGTTEASAISASKAHLMSSTMDEQSLRELTRRVNGQLNRISETNMESITLEMEKIYREYGRSIVSSVLLDKLVQTSVHPKQIMTPLIKVAGALVAALYHSVGSEVGGFFMEKFVQKLISSVDEVKAKAAAAKDSEDDGDDSDPTASKEPANMMLLVAMLYNFGVVQCTLVYDLFRRFVDQFSPVEIELIHQLLKACGTQLRADDADALKEMVASVQQKVASLPNGAQSDDRVRFILDLIYDLKKPGKQKKGSAGGSLNAMSAALDLTSLKKWLGRVKTRCGNTNNAMRVSLHEILHAEQDGRWWVVGGTWVGYQNAKKKQQDAEDQDDDKDTNDNRLLKLADKQRMNTDVRKRIFVAIMGASDCLDAYERLLQLHLKEKQEREIVRVVLHCCGQEHKFNRYYLLLSAKLCEMDPRYKFTYQLAFWDTFKQLDSLKPRKLFNVAQLLAGMIINGAMSLSCLKVIDFTSVEEKTVLFLRLVLEKILKLDDEMEMAQVFQRLLQTKKAQLTIDGLAVFFHQNLTSFKGETDAATRTLLKQRSKSARSLLDALAKSAANTESMKELM